MAMAMDQAKMAEVEALADSLGNVQAACRKLGVNRSLFYKWLKRKESASADSRAAGEAGVPAPKRRRHPQSIPDALTEKVLALAMEYPEWGCDRISHYLSLNGEKVSPTTTQKILTRSGLRTAGERASAARATAPSRSAPPTRR
jgi:transposase-like protein